MQTQLEGATNHSGPAPGLPLLLARLASLQGKAVPWHRFALMTQTSGGASISDLPVTSQAIELWQARFPEGEIHHAEWPLTQNNVPALWIGPDALATQPAPGLLVVRGSLSTGALSCSDADGRSHEIPAELARQGKLLVLRADETASMERDDTRLITEGRSDGKRKTATQWFTHAIRKRWPSFTEGVLATLTVNVISLGASFYSMQVYDRVVPTQGYSTLWVLTVGVAMAIVLELVMRQVRARLVERACKAIDEELSSVFFGHALSIRMDQRPHCWHFRSADPSL